MIIIYKIVNNVNGKIYVGKTSRLLDDRIRSRLKGKSYFPRSLRKYGLDCFSWMVIDSAESERLANWKEEYWIKTLNSKYPNGYNLTDGGDGSSGYKHTKKSRVKFSGVNHYLFGKHRTEEEKERMSKNAAARRPEVRAKIANFWAAHPSERNEHRLKFLGKNNPMFGKKHSKEIRRKMSENSGMKKPEVRERLSLVMSGENNPMFGVHRFGRDNPWFGGLHSEDTKKRISEKLKCVWIENPNMMNAHKGKKRAPEVGRKISEKKKGKYKGEDNPFFGKKHTEETKRKISYFRINRIRKPVQDKVWAAMPK